MEFAMPDFYSLRFCVPKNKVAYDPDATAGSIAASLSYGLIKNHAFIDGNKRIELAALIDFLGLNGFQVTAPEADQIDVVLRVASSEITEADFAAWVERSIAPLV